MGTRRAGLVLLSGTLLFPAGVASADDGIAIDTICSGDDLNSTVTAPDGTTTLRCVADGIHEGFRWEADSDAIKTFADLQNQGYTIRVDKVGANPMSQCKVTSIDDYQASTVTDASDGLIRMTKTVTVSLDCG
ncbi:MAG: hypothetical protein U0R81_06370 [Mycobacterium sp.]